LHGDDKKSDVFCFLFTAKNKLPRLSSQLLMFYQFRNRSAYYYRLLSINVYVTAKKTLFLLELFQTELSIKVK